MDFTVIQNFASTPDSVAQAYASAETYGHLVGLPKLATPEVLERRINGDVVRLRVRHRFVGDLSPAVTAVVDPARLSWVESSVHDLQRLTVTWEMLPDHYPDRLRSSGTCSLAVDGSGCVRTVRGRLKVRALVVGGAVERAIVSGLREHLVHEVPIVDRLALETGGGAP
ncbi:MAG TPA: DUF2505 family protein [Acidimicrobiales bacterium]|nr:DUF2505 family protein [Acidimicrobiales bacterium]